MSANVNERRPPFADEVGALYALIGEAIWHLQHLEDALSKAIAIKLDLKDAPLESVSQARADEILAKRRRPTLGVAVRLIRENAIFSEQLQECLETFLDERNWLVHRLVHQNGEDMNINGRRELLLNRLARISTDARKMQDLIAEDLMHFVVGKGVTKQRIIDQAWRDFLKDRGLV